MGDLAGATTSGTPAGRPLPAVSEVNEPFWTGGARGELMVQQCQRCRRLVHPPTILCPHDHSPELEWTALSGRARLATWTENRHQWFPGIPAPYVVALVTPEEDDRVRILTNLLDVEDTDLTVGLPLVVTFLAQADDEGTVWLPCFRPEGRA